MSSNQVEMDVLDIMYSAKRGFSIADMLLQLNNMYATTGKKNIEQMELEEILNRLTEKGYLRKFKLGIVDNWKITDDGIDYFESQ